MLYSRIVLVANGAFIALVGAYLLWQPASQAETLGIGASGPVALTEFRAMYGGLELALGALLVWWGLRVALVWSGLMLLTFTASGLLFGRLAGVLADGSGGAYLWGVAGYEFALAALGGVGLWLEYRRCASAGAGASCDVGPKS